MTGGGRSSAGLERKNTSGSTKRTSPQDPALPDQFSVSSFCLHKPVLRERPTTRETSRSLDRSSALQASSAKPTAQVLDN